MADSRITAPKPEDLIKGKDYGPAAHIKIREAYKAMPKGYRIYANNNDGAPAAKGQLARQIMIYAEMYTKLFIKTHKDAIDKFTFFETSKTFTDLLLSIFNYINQDLDQDPTWKEGPLMRARIEEDGENKVRIHLMTSLLFQAYTRAFASNQNDLGLLKDATKRTLWVKQSEAWQAEAIAYFTSNMNPTKNLVHGIQSSKTHVSSASSLYASHRNFKDKRSERDSVFETALASSISDFRGISFNRQKNPNSSSENNADKNSGKMFGNVNNNNNNNNAEGNSPSDNYPRRRSSFDGPSL